MKSIVKQTNKETAFTPLERKHHPLGGVKKTKRGSSLKANPLGKKASLQLSNGAHQSFLTGFTIVELLTVMSIIVILISLLVPALTMVRRYARQVRQNAQFHSIDVAMELFKTEFDDYPPSGWKDESGAKNHYCGAMKLAEAMLGQDLLGFHPRSLFMAYGTVDGTPATDDLYPEDLATIAKEDRDENLRARKGPYLQLENANAYSLQALYGEAGNFTAVDPNELFVMCDVYTRVKNTQTGKKVGMPILYYRANTSNTLHAENASELPGGGDGADDGGNIYNYYDNDELVKLGMPWDTAGTPHPLWSGGGKPITFYEKTRNKKISVLSRPYNADTYILLSAGFDGIYGTDDDIFNFQD